VLDGSYRFDPGTMDQDQLPVSSRISGDDPSKLQKSNLDVEYEDGNEWNTDPEKEEKLTAFASM
ncbi:hypothetical protein FRC00_000317, partial [Tulasnella sp. 408]